MVIFRDLRYVEQQLLIRIALNILEDINTSVKLQCRININITLVVYFYCEKKSAQSPTLHTADLGRGSVSRLPCPARCAGPTAWTPACRLRRGSRSGTAASPCRYAGTARIPGLSPRARVPPRSRSRVRVRDRVRVLTSWSSAEAAEPQRCC